MKPKRNKGDQLLTADRLCFAFYIGIQQTISDGYGTELCFRKGSFRRLT